MIKDNSEGLMRKNAIHCREKTVGVETQKKNCLTTWFDEDMIGDVDSK